MSADQSLIEVKPGSERSFGWVFAIVFAIIGLLPLLNDGQMRWWSLIIAALLVCITLTYPAIFAKPNYWWFRFGLLLGSIIAPIVMGAVYLITLVPMGVCIRLLGKDLLRIKYDKQAKTYWIKRDTPLQSMKRQF